MKQAWNQMFKVLKSTSDTGKVWPLEVGGQRSWCLCSAGRRPKRLFKIKLRKSPTVNIGLGQCHRVWRAKVTLTVSTTALPLVDPKQRAGVNERSTHTVHSDDHEKCCPSLCLLILWKSQQYQRCSILLRFAPFLPATGDQWFTCMTTIQDASGWQI